MSNSLISAIIFTFAITTSWSFGGHGQWVPYPSAAETDAVTAQMASGSFDEALVHIHAWLNGSEVPWALWHDWLPSLISAGRFQEAADLALTASFVRPDTDYIGPLIENRTEALLKLEKPIAALQAAKGYYNVCSISETPDAIQLVSRCLAKVHADDAEIVRRFRAEQTSASETTSNTDPPRNVESKDSILKGIIVDADAYKDALKEWKGKTDFLDRVRFGNLLLLSDQSSEAEKLFRELYQLANSQDELKEAIEGIARSLRAEDGNVARANEWLLALAAKQAGGSK